MDELTLEPKPEPEDSTMTQYSERTASSFPARRGYLRAEVSPEGALGTLLAGIKEIKVFPSQSNVSSTLLISLFLRV